MHLEGLRSYEGEVLHVASAWQAAHPRASSPPPLWSGAGGQLAALLSVVGRPHGDGSARGEPLRAPDRVPPAVEPPCSAVGGDPEQGTLCVADDDGTASSAVGGGGGHGDVSRSSCAGQIWCRQAPASLARSRLLSFLPPAYQHASPPRRGSCAASTAPHASSSAGHARQRQLGGEPTRWRDDCRPWMTTTRRWRAPSSSTLAHQSCPILLIPFQLLPLQQWSGAIGRRSSAAPSAGGVAQPPLLLTAGSLPCGCDGSSICRLPCRLPALFESIRGT